jgi:hypothetical protein
LTDKESKVRGITNVSCCTLRVSSRARKWPRLVSLVTTCSFLHFSYDDGVLIPVKDVKCQIAVQLIEKGNAMEPP